jgi:hypothetical protein
LLALDGVHVGVRAAHRALPCVLCGGGALADRAHLFWECPPALAVRGALQQELARRGCAVVLERRHVWLMQCPDRALHADLWRVACLAAVSAMEKARCYVYTLREKLPADPLSNVGCKVAHSTLLASVADYAALGDCRPAARACVLSPHLPFFWEGHAHRMALVLVG